MRGLSIVAALAALLLLAGCGGTSTPDEVMAEQPAQPSPDPGQPEAPDGVEVSGTSLDGKPLALSDFRGRPVFVNVWSSW